MDPRVQYFEVAVAKAGTPAFRGLHDPAC